MEPVETTEELPVNELQTLPGQNVIEEFKKPEDLVKPYVYAIVEIGGITYCLVRSSNMEAIYAGGVSKVVVEALKKARDYAGNSIESTGSVYPIDERTGKLDTESKLFERRFRIHSNQSLL